MARETIEIIRSDLSGKEVPENEAAQVFVTFADKSKRYRIELDLAESEIPAPWLSKEHQKPLRGARPGRGARTRAGSVKPAERQREALETISKDPMARVDGRTLAALQRNEWIEESKGENGATSYKLTKDGQALLA